MEGATLVVVEDAANRSTVFEDDVLRFGLRRGARDVRRGGGGCGSCRAGGLLRCLHPGRFRFPVGGIERRDDGQKGGFRGPGTLLKDAAFYRPQAADFASHLDLYLTVEIEDRLGHVAKEVIGAVAVGHSGKHLGNAGEEGLLLVRDPRPNRLIQRHGPFGRLLEQTLDLRGGT